MIGDRQRGHPQRLGALDQVRDLAGPVQQAVMAVAVEMDEGAAGHRRATPGSLSNLSLTRSRRFWAY